MVMALAAIVVLVVVFGVPHPKKALLLAIGGTLGAIAGVLQLLAISAQRDRFLRATTALEVRKAMTASKAGYSAICLVSVVGALFVLVTLSERGTPVAAAIGGFALFICIREAVALKGCFDLQRSPSPQNG